MKIRTLAGLDISYYQSLPNYNTAETRVLGGALVEYAPKQLSPLIDKSVVKLEAQLELIDEAYAEKQRATASSLLAEDGELDLVTDAAWAGARKGLERWQAFAAKIMAELPKQAALQVKMLAARKKAERAAYLHGRLFGKDGLRFTGMRYTEQVGETRARLQMLKEDGLLDEFEELVGEETVAGLWICQERYEEMVKSRLARDGRLNPDFRGLRREARVRILHYASTILAMLDEDEPESFDLLDRLQPLVTARANYLAGRRGPEVLLEEGSEDAVDSAPADSEPGTAAE